MPIRVRVQPNAKKSELVGFSDGIWQVRVSAPPVKGKANAALLALLSKALKLPANHLSMVRGHTSRTKVIAVDGLSDTEVMKRLAASCDTSSK